jgi:hypothetical protein
MPNLIKYELPSVVVKTSRDVLKNQTSRKVTRR